MRLARKDALASVFVDAVERHMRDFLGEIRNPGPLFDQMEYHLGLDPAAGPQQRGKKLRPVLLLSLTQTLGGDVTAALPIATAVEFLHSAALVFDDIQDGSDVRRGRPAVWRRCGQAEAMNVGVALQAAAHLAVAHGASAGLPPDCVLAAGEEMGLCTLRLAEGQGRDLLFERGGAPSIDDYMRMCASKCASLFTTAAFLGVLLGGRRDLAETARRFGYHFGMHLQIEDDIAGIWGDRRRMGKAAADIEGRKKTLPLLYVFNLEDEGPELADLRARYMDPGPLTADEAERLRRCAEEFGGHDYARQMSDFHRGLARRALEEIAEGRTDLTVLLEGFEAATLAAV